MPGTEQAAPAGLKEKSDRRADQIERRLNFLAASVLDE
jgi:hypothetical protein